MRTFIALSLPTQTQNFLGDSAAKMAYQDKSNAVRWVDQENYHVTLAFLGEQDAQQVDRLAYALDDELASYGVYSRIAGICPFPETRPKAIAAMLDRTESLLDVQKQVVRAITQSQLLWDKRRFIPHITLGRIRHTRNTFTGMLPLTLLEEIDFDEVVLFESVLSSHGAEYQAIYRYPLNDHDFSFDLDD